MTKSASEWPKGVIERKDNFSQKTVRGVIGNPISGSSTKTIKTLAGTGTGYVTAVAPPTAGVKPNDVIVRKYTTINRVIKYYWENQTTGEKYNAAPIQVGSRDTATIKELSKTEFVKTSWLGLAFGGGGQGSYTAAYQLWVKKGSSGISAESINEAYVRRGGAFTSTTGTEWFTPYDDIRGDTSRYAPRRIGGIYRDAAEQERFRSSIFENYGVSLADANEAAIAAGFEGGFDWVSGTWPINVNGWPPTVADIISAATAINGPLNFGGGGPGGGPGGGNQGRSSGIQATPDLPVPAITITTRMPKGYAGRGVATSSRPQMVQRYRTDNNNHADEAFIFRYIPQGIKYSGLSGNWVEVPRAEDIPFVDWASWQLMKVSFSFIIAADRTEPGGAVVPDGLDIPIDAQIEKLRRMAQRKVPVTLLNFDDMLTFQLRRGNPANTGTQVAQPNMEFVIQDFSVTATRRTALEARAQSDNYSSLISVAQCEITLTEIPVETVGIIALPPITTPGLPPPSKKPPGIPGNLGYELISAITASKDAATNGYINPNIE
jgi:hypothetical protein